MGVATKKAAKKKKSVSRNNGNGNNSSKRLMTRDKEKVLKQVRTALGEDNENDDDFDDDNTGDFLSGTGFRTPFREEDEIVIDEMLSTLTGSGWYIKLAKETAPNEFQFKKRIDKTTFQHWSDMELEITKVVQAETQAEYKKARRIVRWGSARYQVSFGRDGGLRGERKPPVIFDVDAAEPDEMYSPRDTQAELYTFLRETAGDPNTAAERHMEALRQGMKLGVDKEIAAGSSQDRMMQLMITSMNAQQSTMATMVQAAMNGNNRGPDATTMMQQLISMAKDMGIVGSRDPKPEKPFIQQLSELKAAGFLTAPADTATSNDPMKQLTNFRNIMGIIRDIGGAPDGERPSLIEKVIEQVGPRLPDLVSNLIMLAKSNPAIQAQIPAPAQIQSQPYVQPQAPVQPQTPLQPQPQPQTQTQADNTQMQAQAQAQGQTQTQPTEDLEMIKTIRAFAEELFIAVSTYDTTKNNYITDKLNEYMGDAEKSIITGQWNKQTLVEFVMKADASLFMNKYVTMDTQLALDKFVEQYIQYVIANNPYLARCNKCGTYMEFMSKDVFLAEEDKTCSTTCNGVLQPTL